MRGQTLIHYTFTCKYRFPLLDDPRFVAGVEALMRRAAAQQGMTIKALAIQSEHVHVFVILPRTLAVSTAAQELKRMPSQHLRRAYPELQELRAMWGRRYHHRSVGGDSRQVAKYIEAQMRTITNG